MAAPYGLTAGRDKPSFDDGTPNGAQREATRVVSMAAHAANAALVPHDLANGSRGGRRRLLLGLVGAVLGGRAVIRAAQAQGSAQGQGSTPAQGQGPAPGQYSAEGLGSAQGQGSARGQGGPAAAGRTAPIRLLILGDSLTAGYGLAHEQGFQARLLAALKARGYDVALIDGAVSGDTSAGGRARLDWSLGDGADAAIVELGGNDGLRGLDPKEMQANLTAILDALAARHIPVLLSGMYAPPNLGPDYQRAFRAVFDGLGKRPGVLYDPFFLEGVATVTDLNQGDGIHPNPEGVRRIVARLLPLVEKLLAEIRPA